MKVLRGIGWFALAAGALAAVVVVGARYSDGPLGPLAGGAFRSGSLYEGPEPDWSRVADVEEVELQLLEPPRSRITWIVVHEGRPYIPCGFVNVSLWKQWPHEAAADGRALLRIDGTVYERALVKVEDPETHRKVATLVTDKYEVAQGLEPDPELLWIFRLDPAG